MNPKRWAVWVDVDHIGVLIGYFWTNRGAVQTADRLRKIPYFAVTVERTNVRGWL